MRFIFDIDNNFAAVHHDEPIAKAQCITHVVRDHERGETIGFD